MSGYLSTTAEKVKHCEYSDRPSGIYSNIPIDGGILQAGVSDKQVLLMMAPKHDYQRACETAEQLVQNGKDHDILPF